jgi:hypothetical protein
MDTRMTQVAGIIMVAAVTACSSSGVTGTTPSTENVADSTFTAQVTGSVTDSLTGPAFFENVENTAGTDSEFAFSLGIGTTTGAIVLKWATAGPPATGSYPLYPDTSSAAPSATQFYGIGILGGTCSGCTSTGTLFETSGTLTITSVTTNLISGTFTWSGFEIPSSNASVQNSIAIAGAFVAGTGPAVIDTSGAGPCLIAVCAPALSQPIVESGSVGDWISAPQRFPTVTGASGRPAPSFKY